jgi:tetratricopeptide (TPR) repeat protein
MILIPFNMLSFLKQIFPAKVLLFILFSITAGSFVKAQPNTNEQLAIQYFQDKEFEKAAILFEDIYNAKPTPFIYDYYFKCLVELKDYKKAEKFIAKTIKKQPLNSGFGVDLGYIYLLEQDQDKAKKQFETLIKQLTEDKEQVNNLANAFLQREQVSYALKTYEQGQKLLKNIYNFNLELAEIYLKQNDFRSALDQFLEYIKSYPDELDPVEAKLQDILLNDPDFSKNDIFKNSLLQRIKKDPDVKSFPIMLLWHFIQQKEFGSAAVQAKAIDKRFGEDGSRIITLARIAASNGYYDNAIDCYDYIITKKGELSMYYETSQVEKINTKFLKITSSPFPNTNEMLGLEQEYFQLLSKQSDNNYSLQLIKNLAHLQAFYLNKTAEATDLLQKALLFINVSADQVAQCKMELGDILLLTGNVWDASLLYMQVDKAFKNDVTGFEAKFRNAKLYFYIGEFEYAKAQVDILKAATAKLIANDAMQLSLLITDNLDADSSFTGLRLYAHADLLLFQNRDEEALITLDSINTLGLFHPLFDEVLYKKAQVMIRQQKFAVADSILSKLINLYSDDIYGDDALFLLGDINETYLKNPERAKETFYKLLTDFPGSVFAVEARKRFRNLRGDKIN